MPNPKHTQWFDRWKDNRIGFHQNEISPYLLKYAHKLNKNNTVFVPLCGKSLDMLYLSDNFANVIGVELVKDACDAFVKENNLKATIKEKECFVDYKITNKNKENIELLCGDIFDIKPKHIKQSIDIFDRASLVALDKEDRAKYAILMIELMSVGSKMLLVSLEYKQSERNAPPYSVDEQEIQELYANSCKIEMLERVDIKPTSDRYSDLSYMYASAYLITKQ